MHNRTKSERFCTGGVITVMTVLLGCSEPVDRRDERSFDERISVLSEELRIDGNELDLVPVGAIAVRDDGTVAVTQTQDGQIRFFSPMGEDLGAFGSQGEGPGEFMNPYRLGWHGDTLWVLDGRLRRLTLISASLELLETVSNIPQGAHPAPEAEDEIPDFPFVIPVAVGRDRSLYGTFGLSVNQEVPEQFDGRTTLGRMDSDGLIQEIILLLPRPEGGGVNSPDGGSASLPFGNTPEYAISLEAGRVAVAMASLEGPDAETFSLTVTGLTGDTLHAGRFPFDAEVLPTSVADSVFESRVEFLEQFSPSLADAAQRGWEPPPLYPPLTGLVIGSDGTIWVERREREGQQRYHVVSADGEAVGTVSLAEGSEVGVASLSRIWVIETDALGVESVVRYGLSWD